MIANSKGESGDPDNEGWTHALGVHARAGESQRSFTLPVSAELDIIEATYRDGVLALTIPKPEEARPKAVKISVEKEYPGIRQLSWVSKINPTTAETLGLRKRDLIENES